MIKWRDFPPCNGEILIKEIVSLFFIKSIKERIMDTMF